MKLSILKGACVVALSLSMTFNIVAQEKSIVARQHLQKVSAALHLSESDLQEAIVKDEFTSRGMTHVHLGQMVNGTEVWNSDMNFAIMNGQVVSMTGSFISGIQEKVTTRSRSISAEQAISAAALHVSLDLTEVLLYREENSKGEFVYNEAGISYSPITVKSYYLRTSKEELKLVWNVNIQELSGFHWWNIRVDAENGKVLEKSDWVVNCQFEAPSDECLVHSHAPEPNVAPTPANPNDYNIYPVPVESPSHGGRSVVNAPWNAALNASPYGWHDTNGASGAEYTITRGNNVRAQEDRNNNNGTGYSPDGGADLDFDFSLNLSLDPIDYEDAAITNLFYWNNIIHDVLYQYGFDEPSGNFQENNYGNGGAGSDNVNADAQDGGGTNNANFGTPSDGGNPRMQMYLWTGANPDRDGDLDNGIVVHEYGHGVSNRLVGGPSNVNCLNNSEQMGEGWSDIWSLLFTQEVGDLGSDARGIGTYALNQSVNGGGIRPSPYSTNMGVNAYTYGDIGSLAVPHGVGFLWCTMLWEMNWELIAQYGFDPDLYNGTGGNNLCMQLIIDGMKLSPCSPGFVDGRDAILLADQNTNGGANNAFIWAAFAKRGLGFSAVQGSSNSNSDGQEAFDLPPDPKDNDMAITLSISPVEGVYLDCFSDDFTVEAELKNEGLLDQTDIPVHYQLNGGAVVNETYIGTITAGNAVNYQFTLQINIVGQGVNTLYIWSALIGDERTSNDTLTVLLNVIDGSGSVSEDFESYATCNTSSDCEATTCPLSTGWTQVENGIGDDIDWRVDQNGTPSADTGPGQDYVPGNASGNYVYLEASNGCNGKTAILMSPCIDLTLFGSPQFSFAYHMWGANMGELHLDLYNGIVWIDDIMTTISGDQGNAWQTIDVDLSAWSGQTIVLRLRGITGTDYQSDIALDALSVTDLTAPPLVAFNADRTTICDGDTVTFTDQSSNSPNSWLWTLSPAGYNFVNGTNANSQNPEISFSGGLQYTVQLDASNTNGSNVLSKPDHINGETVEAALAIVMDRWGTEITWEITDVANNILEQGGPYLNTSTNGEFPLDTIFMCLPINTCLDLTFHDSYGDGMCCASGNGEYQLLFLNGDTLVNGDGQFSTIRTDNFCTDVSIKVNINAYLEGPYEPLADLMKDDLRVAGYVPLTEPYTALGFVHVNGGGGETIDPAVLSVAGVDAIVDWIFVELRDPNNSSIVLATRTALLQRDGDIVDLDGVSSLEFIMDEGSYFVAVRHRNHLGIMSQTTVLLASTAQFVNLSNGSTTAYGVEPMNAGLPRLLMWTGNSIPDAVLKYTGIVNDRDPILLVIGGAAPSATLSGYHNEDVTLDGIVKYTGFNNDRDKILVNIGGATPTGTRQEQLP